MFCRCEVAYSRAGEHANVPGLPRVPRLPAGAEREGGRVDDQAGPRARLPDRRARDLPPQELLLSRQAEGVPDLPVRRAAVPGRPAGRPGRGATRRSGSSARTWRRTRPRTSISGPPRAGSPARARRSSTSTAAGTPLVEIVTQPDLRSADEARRFLQLLRQTVVELGISDAEMEKGSLRFDVNVSVRPEGSDELRTRTELKNLNSFAFAARAIEREVERQIGIYEAGRRGRAGDAALRPGQGVRAAAALEGGGAGLPLLPRARPRPDRAAGRAGRARPQRAARASGRPDPPSRRASSTHATAADLVTSGRDSLYERVPGDRAGGRERADEPVRGLGRRPGSGRRGRARQADRGAVAHPARPVPRGAREER